MILELLKYYEDFQVEEFNDKLNKFRCKFIKKLIIKLLMNYIYNNYSCESMYCSRELVFKSVVKRMQLNYLYE